jgi:putative endonuclease
LTSRNMLLGKRGEKTASLRLQSMGYEILESNVRTPFGEVDLVAARDGSTIFVEVKTRRSLSHGLPEEAVTVRKKKRLIASAQYYLQQRGLSGSPWRIDVVAVEFDASGSLRRIEVFENAVCA